MSSEQRDNNLGIDPELRNRDPLAYLKALLDLKERQERGLIEYQPIQQDEPLPPPIEFGLGS